MKKSFRTCLVVVGFAAWCSGCGTMKYLGCESAHGVYPYETYGLNETLVGSGFCWSLGPTR